MTVFESAWPIVKMPVYHGTTEENMRRIMQEGLQPTEMAPQFIDNDHDEMKEFLGYDDEKLNQYFGGDWSFYYGDRAKPQPYLLGGRKGAIMGAYDWAMAHDEDLEPVVLEIDDRHPDSPFFMPEPRITRNSPAFNESMDQRRTNKVVPPHLIRQIPQDEIEAIIQDQKRYSLANRQREDMLNELVDYATKDFSNSSRDDVAEADFNQALAMRLAMAKYMRGGSQWNIHTGEFDTPYWKKPLPDLRY
jgi:hypothetical protein